MLDTASILKFTEVKASGLFVLYCGIFEAVELDIKQAVFSNVLVHKNSNSRDAMWWSSSSVLPHSISGFAGQWSQKFNKTQMVYLHSPGFLAQLPKKLERTFLYTH